jgi:hypothetical protein
MMHGLNIAIREEVISPEAIQFCKPFGNLG